MGRAVEVGEEFDLVVRLWNTGEGTLDEGILSVKPLEQGRLYIVRGRAKVEALAAGGSTTAVFRARAMEISEAGTVEVKLWVTDTARRRSFSWTLELPVYPAGEAPSDTSEPDPTLVDIAPQLYQPGFTLEEVHPDGGVGDARLFEVRGIVDYGPTAGEGDVLVAYVNGEKRSVVPFEAPKAGPRGLHRFSLELPLEVGPNRIVLSAIRKGQSQSFMELVYNRIH